MYPLKIIPNLYRGTQNIPKLDLVFQTSARPMLDPHAARSRRSTWSVRVSELQMS